MSLHAYLGYNTAVVQKQLMGTAPPIKDKEYICNWFYTQH
jgi:hypothetical protein